MKRRIFTVWILFLFITGAGFQPAVAGNKKFMTINAAKVLAERAIVESIVGLKVRTTERVEDLVAVHHRIDAKTAAGIKGIEYADIVYDKAKDIAKVTARIHLGRVKTVVGNTINWGDTAIERVAFATSTKANTGPLKALRAAELDAYSQLAKQVVGFNLQSDTTVENYILKNDGAKTRLLAALYGARLVDHRWDQEGNAYVKLTMDLGPVEDILGQKINYKGTLIEVEGNGAQADDFSQTDVEKKQAYQKPAVKIGATVTEGNLNIPATGNAAKEPPANYPAGGISLQ